MSVLITESVCPRCLDHSRSFTRCCSCGYKGLRLVFFDSDDTEAYCKEEIRRVQESLYGKSEFSQKLYDKRIQKENTPVKRGTYNFNPAPATINVPKCPTCDSTEVSKITTTNRLFSIGLFGLASDKIGKQFECKNCGYKW